MVFNATSNNISIISWWSVLLVEYPEKTTDLPQVADKLYNINAIIGIRTHILVMITHIVVNPTTI